MGELGSVLGEALGAARGARLDLAGAETDGEVGDEGVLRLAGAVRRHDAPARRLMVRREEERVSSGGRRWGGGLWAAGCGREWGGVVVSGPWPC